MVFVHGRPQVPLRRNAQGRMQDGQAMFLKMPCGVSALFFWVPNVFKILWVLCGASALCCLSSMKIPFSEDVDVGHVMFLVNDASARIESSGLLFTWTSEKVWHPWILEPLQLVVRVTDNTASCLRVRFFSKILEVRPLWTLGAQFFFPWPPSLKKEATIPFFSPCV